MFRHHGTRVRPVPADAVDAIENGALKIENEKGFIVCSLSFGRGVGVRSKKIIYNSKKYKTCLSIKPPGFI